MSQSEEARFQLAKAYLMQADHQGQSVYEHLHRMIYTMLQDNPNDVVNHPERLQELSSIIKRHEFTNGNPSAQANGPAALHSTTTERLHQNKDLFAKPPPVVTTTIEQPTPFTTVTTTTVKPHSAPSFKSVASQNVLWRHCGTGIPDVEAFLLDQSISKLVSSKNLDEARFVGKIFGTKGNYLVVSSKRYVAEGENVYEEVNEMPKPPRKKVDVDIQPEPGYKGVNRLSFWVASHASADWTLLPDVTPQQINAARKIKKLFSGNLDAAVISSPTFPWPEAVYLRAQLSRLLSGSFITPSGALEKVEPEEEEQEEEEEGKKKGPKSAKYWPLAKVNKEYSPDEEQGVAALLDLEQWVHSEAYIYETGRQTKVPEKPEVEGEEEGEPKEDEEQEEEEEEKKEEEEKDLFAPVKKDFLYAVINIPKEPNPEEEAEEEAEPEPEGDTEEKEEEEEKPLDDEEIPDDDPQKKKITAWTSRLVNQNYKKHAVVVVKSLRWPGAVAYASTGGKQHGAVYFGNGLKKTDHAFTPLAAPVILKECADIVEVMDATAATEKLVLRGEEPKEQDSEDEKEEEEPEEEN